MVLQRLHRLLWAFTGIAGGFWGASLGLVGRRWCAELGEGGTMTPLKGG